MERIKLQRRVFGEVEAVLLKAPVMVVIPTGDHCESCGEPEYTGCEVTSKGNGSFGGTHIYHKPTCSVWVCGECGVNTYDLSIDHLNTCSGTVEKDDDMDDNDE